MASTLGDILDDRDESEDTRPEITADPGVAADDAAPAQAEENEDSDNVGNEIETKGSDAKSGKRRVPLEELVSERQRRQEAERRLAQLEGQNQAYQQINSQRQQAPQEQPDYESQFYQDPVGFMRNAFTQFGAQLENARVQERTATSQAWMRAQHKDYDEMEALFLDAAKADRSLLDKARNHPMPAQYVYETATLVKEAQDVGSIAEMREKMRAELRKEIEAEMKASRGVVAAEATTKSNAGARGASVATVQSQPAFESLQDILR